MSKDTWPLVQERRQLKASGVTGAELKAKTSAVQAASRRDGNNALSKICEELEQHSDRLQTKDLHDKVQQITGQFKPEAIENAHGVTVTAIKGIVDVWRE
ncbi:unnamed protein product [Arctia plantaginis]|uniref:Uncharacterized protein n=1 Tax=Arctia plantaginis TaxID=874455 RepID=A0A8S1BCU0_ARCPL|nr:unnamed protein product [Arctia plantaginis]